MSLELFTQGLVFGLAIAAPVGPIGILTIRRTLVGGLFFGLLSGLGAATADAIYGTITALGLTAVSDILIQQQTWLQLIGGLFLLYLGIQTLRSNAVESETSAINQIHHSPFPVQNSQLNMFSTYASTLLLTLSNPITILSFTAVFAGFGLGSQANGTGTGLTLVVGVFLGSTLWWCLLTGMVTAVRHKLNNRICGLINIMSGCILIGLAAALLIKLLLTA
jgi:threonine/homoserine/homoserine lactone efflux protein